MKVFQNLTLLDFYCMKVFTLPVLPLALYRATYVSTLITMMKAGL
jgi:hypothetical protein